MSNLIGLLTVMAAIAFLAMLFLGNIGLAIGFGNVMFGIFITKLVYVFLTLGK